MPMLIPTAARSRAGLRPRVALAALGLLALAAPVATAEAQLMKRLKKAAEAATQAATDRGASADTDAEGARASSVAFTDDVLEITGARLDQLVAGLDAEAAERPRVQQQHAARLAAYEEATRTYDARVSAYQRAAAAHAGRVEAHERCMERVRGRYDGDEARARREAESEALEQRMDDEMSEAKLARLEALQARMQAAQARGDQAAMRALSDTVQREMAGMMTAAGAAQKAGQGQLAEERAMRAEAAKCPPAGEAPTPPPSPNDLLPADVSRQVTDAGARAARLTPRQYAVLRERVETFVRLQGKTGASRYRFTADELDVLGPRLDALAARGDLASSAGWRTGGR